MFAGLSTNPAADLRVCDLERRRYHCSVTVELDAFTLRVKAEMFGYHSKCGSFSV